MRARPRNIPVGLEGGRHGAQRHAFLGQLTASRSLLGAFPFLLPRNRGGRPASEAGDQQIVGGLAECLLLACVPFLSPGGVQRSPRDTRPRGGGRLVRPVRAAPGGPVEASGAVLLLQAEEGARGAGGAGPLPGGRGQVSAMEGAVVLAPVPVALVPGPVTEGRQVILARGVGFILEEETACSGTSLIP